LDWFTFIISISTIKTCTCKNKRYEILQGSLVRKRLRTLSMSSLPDVDTCSAAMKSWINTSTVSNTVSPISVDKFLLCCSPERIVSCFDKKPIKHKKPESQAACPRPLREWSQAAQAYRKTLVKPLVTKLGKNPIPR
jgi:hypothetical protein